MSILHPVVQVRPRPALIAVPRTPLTRAEGLSTESLRRQLFTAAAAAARGDDHKLLLLFHRHGRVIFGRTEIWTQVPPAFRDNPLVLAWYRQGLRLLGKYYADKLGRPQPVQKIKEAETAEFRERHPELRAPACI